MLNTWRTWQYAQSLSQRTVDERTNTVRRMAEWTGCQPETASPHQIVTWLAEGGEWKARTRWTYHTNLCAWFLWLQKQGHRTDNPMINISKPKRPRCNPHPISNHDMQRLLVVKCRRRTKAMILLAAFQGLRAHEIAKIKGEHLDLVERKMTVTGKGNVTATLPLHHRVIEIAYQMPRRGYWFPGKERGHQRRESVCGTIKEAMIRAGVVGSGHWLRHWFGTALLESGVDVRTVQTLMRHQDLSSTAIYTQVSAQRQADGIQLLDPFRLTPLAEVTSAMRAAVFDRGDHDAMASEVA